MEIIAQDDLVIALVEPAEAESGAWRSAEHEVDIVRIVGSEELGDDTLERLGFVARPRWLNWVARVYGSQEQFEARLPRGERQQIRLGRRHAAREGVRLDARPVTAASFDEFLGLYEAQIAEMPRGRNFAGGAREWVLAEAAEHLCVAAYSDSRMVAGSVWRIRPGLSLLQLRYSAASPDSRAAGLMRAVYVRALETARESGLVFASLGNDPSLYGHVVQPGLFVFKSRFGFSPVPSGVIEPRFDGEHADHFLSMRALADPSIVVAWGAGRGSTPAWPDAAEHRGFDVLSLSRKPDADAGFPYGDGFRRTRLLKVPG